MNTKKLYKKLGKTPLIIAEVGQNHQGSLSLAKKYVKEFSKSDYIVNKDVNAWLCLSEITK